MSKHTKGPWFMFAHAYRDEGPGSFSIGTNADKDLADILCSRFQWPERAAEMEANARLIAAAPDLLEAAQLAASVLFLLADELKAMGLRAENVPEKLRAAIAKAGGAA